MTGAGVRICAAVLGACTLLGLAAAPAAADPPRPTNYRSTVTNVTPALPVGAEVRVIGGDSLIELSLPPGHTAVVADYPGSNEDEAVPYLRFDADGSGRWLPLVHGQGPLTAANGFADQGAVVIKTRQASDRLGATRMDRPEWLAIDPSRREVFCTLTNNSARGQSGQPGVDAANPRANNVMGQIIRWTDDGGSYVDATFVESRLLSLRTRNAAAYKGIAALVLAQGARDWMEDKALDKVQYTDLAVDIHHVFPQKWCNDNSIDDQYRESIVNKTAIGAKTNRTIGGVAPSQYVGVIERNAQIDQDRLDSLLTSHCIDPVLLRRDAFEAFFDARRDSLCALIEQAMGKAVQRDLTAGTPTEDSSFFEPESLREDQSDGEA